MKKNALIVLASITLVLTLTVVSFLFFLQNEVNKIFSDETITATLDRQGNSYFYEEEKVPSFVPDGVIVANTEEIIEDEYSMLREKINASTRFLLPEK